jgi:hypothetical protein
MKNLFKLFTIITLVLVPISSVLAQQQYKNSFILNLYYDKGDISFGKYFEVDDLTVQASTSDFVPPTRSYPLYTASLFDEQGKLLLSAKIDQRGGNSNIQQGPVSIITPFDVKTERIDIINNKGQVSASIPRISSYLCNYNNACEYFLGETEKNCPEDCKIKPLLSPSILTSSTPQSASSSDNTGVIILWIFSGIVLVVGLAMIYIAKKRRGSQG